MLQKVLIPFIAILLLTSCAGKFTLVKRQHNKGFFVTGSKKHSTSKQESNTVRQSVKCQQSKKNPESASQQVFFENNRETVESTPATDIDPTKAKPGQKRYITASAEQEKFVQSQPLIKIKPLTIRKPSAKSQGGDAGANFLVLVILCFLWWLNLIAVYVHDGHKITTNFWVTLLLDFTIIGGIIFSLLVVLDIVDLG